MMIHILLVQTLQLQLQSVLIYFVNVTLTEAHGSSRILYCSRIEKFGGEQRTDKQRTENSKQRNQLQRPLNCYTD